MKINRLLLSKQIQIGRELYLRSVTILHHKSQFICLLATMPASNKTLLMLKKYTAENLVIQNCLLFEFHNVLMNMCSKGAEHIFFWKLSDVCFHSVVEAEGFVRQEQDAYGSVNIQFYCGRLVHRSGLCQVLSFYECLPLWEYVHQVLYSVLCMKKLFTKSVRV